jgi:hypothetical protein
MKENVMSLKRLFVLLLVLCVSIVSAEGLSYTWENNTLTGTETIAATGYVEVSFQNNGDQRYDVTFDRLKEGTTVDDFKANIAAVVEAFASPEKIPEAFKKFYDTVDHIGGVAAAPGENSTVGVLLEPGTYVVSPSCSVCPPSTEGLLTLTVIEGTHTDAPTADLRVEMSEFHFMGLPDELSSGKYLWEIANTGEQGHYLGFFKLVEGKTQDDFRAWMATMGPEGPSGAPPGEMTAIAGGATFLTSGQRLYYPIELTPGTYVAYCPVQDMTSGTPHDILGMVHTLTVR